MNLREITDKYHVLPETSLEELSGNMVMTLLGKETTQSLIKSKFKKLYFLSKGMVRIYMIRTDGKELTFDIFTEGQVILSSDDVFPEDVSDIRMEALEDSALYVMSIRGLEELGNADSEIKELLNEIYRNAWKMLLHVLISNIAFTPEERYRNIASKHPELVDRLQLSQLASYIGVTPQSLSRIRHRVIMGK